MPTVACGETDLHYDDVGSGPVILWIPGTGLRGATWALQIAAFRDRFRCISVDLRGSGGSSGGGSSFTVADLALDAAGEARVS